MYILEHRIVTSTMFNKLYWPSDNILHLYSAELSFNLKSVLQEFCYYYPRITTAQLSNRYPFTAG